MYTSTAISLADDCVLPSASQPFDQAYASEPRQLAECDVKGRISEVVVNQRREEFAGSEFTAMQVLATDLLRRNGQVLQFASLVWTHQARDNVVYVHSIISLAGCLERFARNNQKGCI